MCFLAVSAALHSPYTLFLGVSFLFWPFLFVFVLPLKVNKVVHISNVTDGVKCGTRHCSSDVIFHDKCYRERCMASSIRDEVLKM